MANPVTVDELFAEDFKPEWMLRHEQYIKESFDYAINAGIDLQWRYNAYEVVSKLSKKWPPKKPLPD